MVTSEDCKEVVKALHDLCDGCETVSDYDLAKALCLEAVSRNAYSSDSVLRIADLIEPEPERTCYDDGNIDAFRCDKCGAFAVRSLVTDCTKSIPIRYCPNCGAKVTKNHGLDGVPVKVTIELDSE